MNHQQALALATTILPGLYIELEMSCKCLSYFHIEALYWFKATIYPLLEWLLGAWSGGVWRVLYCLHRLGVHQQFLWGMIILLLMKGDRSCSGEFVWFNLNCISWIIHIKGAVGDESLWFALYLTSVAFWMVSFRRLRIRDLFCGWSSPQSQPVPSILWSLDPHPVLHLLVTIENYNPTLRPRSFFTVLSAAIFVF